jgi:hypothetical protein
VETGAIWDDYEITSSDSEAILTDSEVISSDYVTISYDSEAILTHSDAL